MTIRTNFTTRSAVLKKRIATIERRIRRRRTDIGVALGGIVHTGRDKMISPATLVTAALFGAAIHRSHELHGLRMLAILESANAGLRLMLTATSKASNTQN